MKKITKYIKLLFKQFENYDNVNLSGTFSKNGKFYSYKITYNIIFPEVNYKLLNVEIWKSKTLYITINVNTWCNKLKVKVKVRKRKNCFIELPVIDFNVLRF